MMYFCVEGPDDTAFVKSVFGSVYGDCKYIEYSKWSNKKINDFINTVKQVDEWDYIFLGDGDGKTIDDRKESLLTKYQALESDKVYIVQFEIESWYYAGVNEATCKKLKMKNYVRETDSFTKEMFKSRLDCASDRKYIMSQILENYSIDLAVTRNNSIQLFVNAIKREPVAV